MLSDVADETGPEVPAQESSTQENPGTAPTSPEVFNVAASESTLAGQSRQVLRSDGSERQAKVPERVEPGGRGRDPRVDQIVDTNRSRRGAGVHVYKPRLLEIVARRPTYVGLALWFHHHPAWVEGHTGGSRFTPRVHPF